ncbi:MAG: roadblock/LC7 domain-containing protein [Gemmatimonadota bacterium]|nr:roadblock/LC7 domain-containing protein [Gemmatimonadota bacterium]
MTSPATLPYDAVLLPLSRQRGVLGALVAGERDGLIVASQMQYGVQGEATAALAASLYRKARLSAQAAGLGSVQLLRLEAEAGHICAIGRDDLVVVVLADSRANVGLLRSAMLRAIQLLP